MQFGSMIRRRVFTLVDSLCDAEAVLRLGRGNQVRKTRKGDESCAEQRWISLHNNGERCA
jgi:hypothetical protein